jgi:hypothetical protein
VGCILTDTRRWIVIALMALLAVAAIPAGAASGQPSQADWKAYDDYVAKAEEQILREESSVESFVIGTTEVRDRREAALRRGKVVVDDRGMATAEIPGGLIHHWVGTVFIPGASLADVMAVVQDYDHLARYYAPEVVSSRLISREGDDFWIALRTRDQRVVTVVMDSEYTVHYGRLDAEHQFSFSHSTRVAEIADAGGAHEHAVAERDSHGYLWRLNSYWRFVEASGGVIVQCEAISLTRGVPTGLGWLIGRYVREIPRESLEQTLGATRDAVAARTRLGDSMRAEQSTAKTQHR